MGNAYAKLADDLHHWFQPGDEDWAVLDVFAAEMGVLLEHSGVSLTPLMTCRIIDLATWWLLARRIQQALPSGMLVNGCEPSPAEGKALECRLHPGLEALAKTWERLRKAMKDLTDACKSEGTPLGKGLADTMKPILQQADGVLEDALAFEQARKGTKTPASSSHTKTAKTKPGGKA